MKTLRRAIAASLALALALFSPGPRAWAAVVEVAGAASQSAAGVGAAGAAATLALPAASIPAGVPVAAPLALNPAVAPAPAAALGAPSASAVQAAASAQAAPEALPAAVQASANPAAHPVRAGPARARTPVRSALAGVRLALPDLSRLTGSGVRAAAADDFAARVGALTRPAAAASETPEAPAVAHASSLAPFRAGPARTAAAVSVPVVAPAAARVQTGRWEKAFGLLAGGAAAATAGSLTGALIVLPLVLVSLVLHEIGHAKVAAYLGDPTATLQGRASFNPLEWWRHVDPLMTLVLPVVSFMTMGFIFGGAKPVPVEASYFKDPVRDMAKVAFAGPAVNLALAGLGALAFAGAAAGGMGVMVLGAISSFVLVNSLLALLNLIPLRPLDGGHILAAALPARVSARVDAAFAKLGPFQLLPVLALFILFGGTILAAAVGLTHLLLGAAVAATGVQLAGSVLPAVAALGLAMGTLRGPPPTPVLRGAATAAASESPAAESQRPVEIVVVFPEARAVNRDLHLTQVDPAGANYVQAYESVQRTLLSEMSSAGLDPDTLASFNATPIASYRRINAATIRLDASRAAEFEAMLKERGDKVYPNERRRIIEPVVPVLPEGADPEMRRSVSMDETLRLTGADAVLAEARKRWGDPDMNPWRRALRRLLGRAEPPQPKIGVIDSGADLSHPLLKRVQEVKNMTSGENKDDIGHGSWVTSMVLNYAPWTKNLTHYKTFSGGGATLDDILKSLNAAANDGSLVISNSWGSDDGDPESPDSLLVKKLASEGHIMVFAAGNAGPGANTVGSPAIVQYKDAQTGAIRVLAVAAADRNKKIAYFSSRGPGSQKTQGKDGFAHRPDLTAVGYNTEGAWPAALGDADRTDPELGPVKAISGTSMSTPDVAGAIQLLAMMFGVTEVGPKLDAIVSAVMGTLDAIEGGPDAAGSGFLNVRAAYERLHAEFSPGTAPATAVARFRRLESDRKSIHEYLDPSSEANRVAGDPAPEIVDLELKSLAGIRKETAALEAAHPTIRRDAAGPLARLWMRIQGRALREAHDTLEGRVFADQFEQADFWRTQAHLLPQLRGEARASYERTTVPAHESRRRELDAMNARHRLLAKPARDLGMTEFGVLNLLGVVASLTAGALAGHLLLGVLGTFVAPVPLIYVYVALRRLLGDAVRWPVISFRPTVAGIPLRRGEGSR
jgi:Zn-dependent protease